MAKAKPQDDASQAPPDAGQEQPPSELDALKAQLAELQAKNAELTERLLAQPEVPPVSGITPAGPDAPYWRVEIEGGPSHVVQAVDAANAQATYMQEMGVIGTERKISVGSATQEEHAAAQAKRMGLPVKK